MVVGQGLHALLGENAQGDAYLHVGKFTGKQVHRVENLPEVVVNLRPPTPARHIAKGADALFVDMARRLQDLLRLQHRVALDVGAVVAALGAESAVLAATAGLCVDNRAAGVRFRKLDADLVRQ